jgi:hypothetical protein
VPTRAESPITPSAVAASDDAADAPADWAAALAHEARARLQAGEPEVWKRLADRFEGELLRTALALTTAAAPRRRKSSASGATPSPARCRSWGWTTDAPRHARKRAWHAHRPARMWCRGDIPGGAPA